MDNKTNRFSESPPTDRQMNTILIIESNLLDVKFTGKTAYDAHKFIRKNIKASYAVKYRRGNRK